MKQKSPQAEFILGILFALLGLFFVIYGLRLVGVSRIIFLICGVIDFIIAYVRLKPFLMKK